MSVYIEFWPTAGGYGMYLDFAFTLSKFFWATIVRFYQAFGERRGILIANVMQATLGLYIESRYLVRTRSVGARAIVKKVLDMAENQSKELETPSPFKSSSLYAKTSHLIKVLDSISVKAPAAPVSLTKMTFDDWGLDWLNRGVSQCRSRQVRSNTRIPTNY